MKVYIACGEGDPYEPPYPVAAFANEADALKAVPVILEFGPENPSEYVVHLEVHTDFDSWPQGRDGHGFLIIE